MTSGTSKVDGGVLIVDDDELIRETLSELVQMVGCSAMVAANGKEALTVMREHRPCLVILDLLMPVMTGNELLEVMRHEPALASVPVVVSTSAPDRAPAGIPIIRKPVNIDAVVEWMQRTCHCAVGLPGSEPRRDDRT
jgi:CheY-like chemotaxis protein